MVNLSGKTRAQIALALEGASREVLLDVICSLATVEEALTPGEIARRLKIDKRDVIREMKAGKMGGGYFARSFNSLRASASGVNAWWASYFVPAIATHKKDANGSEPVSAGKRLGQKAKSLTLTRKQSRELSEKLARLSAIGAIGGNGK